MSARLPTLYKTPFVLDPRPLHEATSSHAGLLAVSRAYRSLGVPALIAANLRLRKRQRGHDEAQMLEALSLLQVLGGECPEDVKLLAGDQCLERGLGYCPPKVTALREFLELFHDKQLETRRPAREEQKSFIFPPSGPIQGLTAVQDGLVSHISRLYEKRGQVQRIATIDQDATIIESHKATALWHYEGGRGYQPMVAVWAELDLVVADEFRDGNVPAKQDPLTCAQAAFAALPATVKQRYFRGDSACHNNELLGWLRHPDRAGEPGGPIYFAVSAMLSEPLAAALRAVGESEWQTFGKEDDGTLRQWAEVAFVPTDESEHKDSKPLRYVGLRLLKPQGVLFKDGTDRHHYAVVTNQVKLDGGKLLDWHREKAGTVEHTHDEVKNELGGGHMPSQRFGVNTAWFKVALLTYNVVSAIKGLALEGEERTARMKRFRLLLIEVAGRMNRNNCVMGLRLCHDAAAIKRMQQVWQVFELPTQATSAKALGRRPSG